MGNCIGMSLILKHKYQMQKDEEITTTYELCSTNVNTDDNRLQIPHSNAVK